jgi:hypothetical protein
MEHSEMTIFYYPVIAYDIPDPVVFESRPALPAWTGIGCLACDTFRRVHAPLPFKNACISYLNNLFSSFPSFA